MINFSLSEDQQQFRDLAREFAKNEIRPVAAQLDEQEKFPAEVCRKGWELGLMNVHVPKEYGGLGLGVLEECLISEEIGWGCAGVGSTMTCNTLAIAPVIVAGNDDQKKRFLSPLIEEFSFCAYAVTEPGAGSDVQGIKTTAKKMGNDYVLNGQKMWITNAAQAKWFFVIAYTDQTKGHKGISGFLVPADSPGVKVGKHEHKMGERCSDTRGVAFEDVEVPAINMLGKEGDGWKAAMAALERSRTTNLRVG